MTNGDSSDERGARFGKNLKRGEIPSRGEIHIPPKRRGGLPLFHAVTWAVEKGESEREVHRVHIFVSFFPGKARVVRRTINALGSRGAKLSPNGP